MPKFCKKPVVIEAVQFTGFSKERNPVFEQDPTGWLLDAMKRGEGEGSVFTKQYLVDENHTDVVLRLVVHSWEGEIQASPGDWILKGIKGGLSTCKPEIFATTYDVLPTPPQDSEAVKP